MAMLSMLHLYTIVTAFTAGGFCLQDPDDGSEICTKTVTMVTMQDATGLAKQLETIIMGNKEGGVIVIHTSIRNQEDNRNLPTPTIELVTTTNEKDLTTSNPTATDDSQQSDAEATSNAQTLTTISKDDVTSKPNDTTIRITSRTTATKDEVIESTPYDSDSSTKTYSDSTTTNSIDVTTSTTPGEPVAGMSTASHSSSVASDSIDVTTVTTAGEHDIRSSTEFHGDTITTDWVQGTTATTAAEPDIACDTSHFIFPNKGHQDYVQHVGLVPEMSSLTACSWIRPVVEGESVAGTLLSYCTSISNPDSKLCTTVHVKISDIPPLIRAYFESKTHSTEMSTSIKNRSYLCIVKSTSSTFTYVNGSSLPSSAIHNPNPVPGKGVLILGQSQHGPISGTSPGKQTYQDEGFRGEIEGFTVWQRALNASEILEIYQSDSCYCPSDAVVTFDRGNSTVSGNWDSYSWDNACNQYD